MTLAKELERLVGLFTSFQVCPRCNYKHKKLRKKCKCSFVIDNDPFFGWSYKFSIGRDKYLKQAYYTINYFQRSNMTNITMINESCTKVWGMAINGELSIKVTEEEIDNLRLLA